MLIGIALVVFRFCQNCNVGLLPEVSGLLNTNAIALITVFCFQNINSLVQLTFRYTESEIGALGNINHALLVYFLLQGFGNLFGLILLCANTVLVHGTNGRFRHAKLLSDFFPANFRVFLLQLLNIFPLRSLAIVACFGLCNAEFRCAELILGRKRIVDGLKDLALGHTLGLKLLDTRQEVAGMLVRSFTAAPRITARVTLGAIMLQNIILAAIFNAKVVFQVFFDRIHISTLPFSSLQ